MNVRLFADINECLSPQVCSTITTPPEAYACVNTMGSYDCTCRAGYTTVDLPGRKLSCIGECSHKHNVSFSSFLMFCSVACIHRYRRMSPHSVLLRPIVRNDCIMY